MAVTLEHIRAQFPLLHKPIAGQRLIYLDNAATTQKPQCVIDALNEYYCHSNANVHRGGHRLGATATSQFESARTTVQQFIHAADRREIIWTRGTTEAINLVAQSWGRTYLKPGDEIVLTELEHHANIVPWQLLAHQVGAIIKVVPLAADGGLDIETYSAHLNRRTKLVALTHVANATGWVNPVVELTAMAKKFGATVLVDGAQAVAHLPIDVQAIDCDFYVFSGHKVFAPTGIGVLYGKYSLLAAMPPWQTGGEMVTQVSFTASQFQPPPLKFEAGTPAIGEAIALATALRFLSALDRTALQTAEHMLKQQLEVGLRALPRIKLYPAPMQAGIVSFSVQGHHHQDIATWLDQQGIAVRAGHHCAMPLIAALGVTGTVRVSLSIYNTAAEIEALCLSLRQLLHVSNTATRERSGETALARLRRCQHGKLRYRELLLLGAERQDKTPSALHAQKNLIPACESKVWLNSHWHPDSGTLQFNADSEAKIMRGLLILVIELATHKTPRQIQQIDFQSIFAELDLETQLSPSRSHGLQAIVAKIQHIAKSYDRNDL